jgi:ATP-dependent Clp protease ATP-binding subunit ClpC
MWNRLTERTRRAVYSADEEARARGSNVVLPEHLFLGILAGADGVAVRILSELGLSVEVMRAAVERQLVLTAPRGAELMELSDEGRKAIDHAYLAARDLNNNCIGTEHLLLGLMHASDGRISAILTPLGVSYEAVMNKTKALQQES